MVDEVNLAGAVETDREAKHPHENAILVASITVANV